MPKKPDNHMSLKYRIFAALTIFIVSNSSASMRWEVHWVALYPPSLNMEPGENVDELMKTNWTIDVFQSQHSSQTKGALNVQIERGVYDQAESMIVHYVPEDGKDTPIELIYAVVSDRFHPYLPIVQLSNDHQAVQVQFSERVGPVWLKPGKEFDEKFKFAYLKRGMMLDLELGNSSEYRTVVIEYVNTDSVLIRDVQNLELDCDLYSDNFEPYTTEIVPKSSWIKDNGESIFKYFEVGC